MKKKIFIFLLFLPMLAQAQVKKPQNYPEVDNKTIHFGFTIGASTYDYRFKRNLENNLFPDAIDAMNSFGLQVTIVSDLRLNKYMDLRFLPGLALGQTNISFSDIYNPYVNDNQGFELAALQFPLQLKFRSQRLNNYRPYLIGGFNYMYDMTGVKQGEDEEIFLELKRGNFNLEIGYGIDLYLQYFKLSPEIKFGIGLTDMVNRNSNKGQPDYVNSIDRISSYYVMFNFHFE